MCRATAILDKRGAFTLIELLIVTSIIAVLVALAAAAAFKLIGTQRVSNTENAMRSINKTLQAHWDQVKKDASIEPPSAAIKALAGGHDIRARVLWIKVRLAEAFPQTYTEVIDAHSATPPATNIYGVGPYGPWIEPQRRKYMKTYFDEITLCNPAKTNPLNESGACLYMALNISRGGVTLDTANLVTSIADTDGDGIKELFDSWGQPLRFQRFNSYPPNVYYRDRLAQLFVERGLAADIPNAIVLISLAADQSQRDLAEMNPRAGQPKAKFGDSVDPDGLLQHPGWLGSPSLGPVFSQLCNHPFLPPPLGPQPYFVPHLVSNGPDGIPFTEDDVYGFRLRVGSGG
jgi:prepilin-type N-terminal cleavage/methylation domain-containing protein